MTDTPEARAELTRIETEMKALSPTTDAWWAWRGRRNDLRDAIDPAWRVLHGFGTRPDQTALDAWPTKSEARWRILRAYIEDYCGERVGDLGATTKRLTALGRTKLGDSVREWIALVDQLDNDGGWFHVFRDSLSCKPHGAKRFSLMVGGEDDFHWTILTTDTERRQEGIEVIATGVLALVAPAAYWIGHGGYDPAGWWLWLFCWLQSAASIVYAYLRLNQRDVSPGQAQGQGRSDWLRLGRRALLYTSFNLGLSTLLAWPKIIPTFVFIPFLIQWLETLWGIFNPAVGWKPARIGIRQLIVSIIWTVFFIISWSA